MKNPLVSVIIPLYNAASYIEETLQSVLNQTYDNIEIIVVDDGSTDAGFALARSYKSEKINVYSQANAGACVARNFGYKKSRGYFIQFLDGDDLLSPTKIAEQVAAIATKKDAAAICSTHHFYKDIKTTMHTDAYLFSTEKPEELFITLWGGKGSVGMIQTSAWLVPRSLIEKYGVWDESLSKDQDGEFFARICMHAKEIKFVPTVKNYYRRFVAGTNVSAGKQEKHLQSNLKSTQLKQTYLFEKTRSSEAKLAMATQFKHVAIEAYPTYKKISHTAMLACKKLGGSKYLPVLGGKSIEYIKTVFGWKAAKLVRRALHSNQTIGLILRKLK